jgi:hypothetical protein
MAIRKLCDYCPGKEYRRLNRNGFLERKVYPIFGFYPWECALCRRKAYLQSNGHKPRKPTVTSETVEN